ncbi:MAG: hypothetical protein V5B36_00915 [Candidatus Accumulibacter sp. UW25]|jgi:hypothetical protein
MESYKNYTSGQIATTPVIDRVRQRNLTMAQYPLWTSDEIMKRRLAARLAQRDGSISSPLTAAASKGKMIEQLTRPRTQSQPQLPTTEIPDLVIPTVTAGDKYLEPSQQPVQQGAVPQGAVQQGAVPQPTKASGGAFNYDTEKAIADQKKQLAARLIGAKQPEGQMVGGWYAAPGIGAHLAATLQNLAGGYMLNKNDEEQRGIDTQAAATQARILRSLTGEQDTQAPEAVAPPQANTAPGLLPEGEQQSPIGQAMQPQANTAPGLLPEGEQQSPIGQAMQPPAMQPQANTAPKQAPQMSQAEQLAAVSSLAQTGPQGQALAGALLTQLFGKNGEYKIEISKDGNSAIQYSTKDPNAIRVIPLDTAAKTEIVETDQGKFVRNQRTNEMTPLLDQSGNQVQSVGAAKDAQSLRKEMAAYNAQEKARLAEESNLKRAREDVYSLLSGPTEDGVSKAIISATGTFATVLSHITPGGSTTADTRAKVTSALNNVVLTLMSYMKASGIGTQAFNSDKEGERLMTAIANIDWNNMTPRAIQDQILGILKQIEEYEKLGRDFSRQNTINREATQEQQSRQVGSVPQGIPARGERSQWSPGSK